MRTIIHGLPVEGRVFETLGSIVHHVHTWADSAKPGEVCGFCLGSSSDPKAIFYGATMNRGSVTIRFDPNDPALR